MREGQSIEHVMTYGWVVLIIALIAASLYYLNIFGGSCKSPITTGFNEAVILRNDFSINSDGSADIIVSNAAASSLEIVNVSVYDSRIAHTGAQFPQTIITGNTLSLKFTGLVPEDVGRCASADVEINYTKPGSDEILISKGTIRTEVK